MEVNELPGYAEDDKLAIARRYLVPRQLEAAGLSPAQLSFTEDALREIIRGYTREAGVRQLEREIGAICRGVATRFADGGADPVTVNADAARSYLGPAKFFNEVALRTSLPGVATGLAWTAVGGEILFVEASRMPGAGKLLLTGHLGDVVKESAQAALSLVRSRAARLGLDVNLFRRHDLHIYIPAGAIPKRRAERGHNHFCRAGVVADGTAGQQGRRDDRGNQPARIGFAGGQGKRKSSLGEACRLSARYLPALNRKDLDELAPAVRDTVGFEFVESVDEALRLALEPAGLEPEMNGEPRTNGSCNPSATPAH